jgi:hypothetical protein
MFGHSARYRKLLRRAVKLRNERNFLGGGEFLTGKHEIHEEGGGILTEGGMTKLPNFPN